MTNIMNVIGGLITMLYMAVFTIATKSPVESMIASMDSGGGKTMLMAGTFLFYIFALVVAPYSIMTEGDRSLGRKE